MPIFIDLQRPAATQSNASFLCYIARTICRGVQPSRFTIPYPTRSTFEANPFEAFDTWLEDVALPILHGFNLFLTFDEFERLGEVINAGHIDRVMLDLFRHLIQHQTRLALLFAGVQSLSELGLGWSSYFINVKPLFISYLSLKVAEALIRDPDLGAAFKLTYALGVVEEIMVQTHRQPYLIQLVGSALVEEANASGQLHITNSLLQAAFLLALKQGELYFHNVWTEAAGVEGQPLLKQIAQANTPLPLKSTPALTRLVQREVLWLTEGGYEVVVPLVKRWILIVNC